jgi:hypothetical protein
MNRASIFLQFSDCFIFPNEPFIAKAETALMHSILKHLSSAGCPRNIFKCD